MPSEEGFAFGDVVLVPFPFTSQDTSKRRPAVIVSGARYNRERPDVVMMPVTSQLRPSPSFGEVWLEGWLAAGLLKPSAVKPVLATFERNLVIRKLGALTADDRMALGAAIQHIFGEAIRAET